MIGSDFPAESRDTATHFEEPLLDPREGDVEDDAASPKQRSFLAIAGSLLAEISLAKLAFAWTVLILLPAVLLGAAPLVVTIWFAKVSRTVAEFTGLGTVSVLLVIAGLGWFGWRPLWQAAEANFWSLNALAVQPGYAFCREALRHLAESLFSSASTIARSRSRAISSAAAGIIMCLCGALVALFAWPGSRWVGTVADLVSLRDLLLSTLANAVVVIAAYCALASLVWGFADASMEQPIDLPAFASTADGATWRVAHLSDVHMVGEQYGFRIECGRNGPRGNGRIARVMARLEAMHSVRPLDLLLVSGDMTDSGRATEWAEFMDVVAQHSALAERMIILPGNHDVNIVDRLNPARLDLPFSPGKRLRQMRALSAMASVQGSRVRVMDPRVGTIGRTLNEALAPHRQRITRFANSGSLWQSIGLGRLWDDQFPMILPPTVADGFAVAILNSNAETHFSFTNALGMISAEQMRRLVAAVSEFPRARWIFALHHHVMEYPMSKAKLSERIGTALINGTWFVRRLKPFAEQAVVMHGHRHIDWIGASGKLRIISAPSPVMGAKNDVSTYFLIHNLASAADDQLWLLPPERVDIDGTNEPD
jgi:3',5'-cyclic AMP phosphodiesterase CpdA